MTSNYVRGASVTASAYQREIQAMLAGYGATGLRCTYEDRKATISFAAEGGRFRIVLALPRSADDPLQPPSTGHAPKAAQESARQRWRALSVLVRAKLDAVASGIVTFDQEFLAYRVPHTRAQPSRLPHQGEQAHE